MYNPQLNYPADANSSPVKALEWSPDGKKLAVELEGTWLLDFSSYWKEGKGVDIRTLGIETPLEKRYRIDHNPMDSNRNDPSKKMMPDLVPLFPGRILGWIDSYHLLVYNQVTMVSSTLYADDVVGTGTGDRLKTILYFFKINVQKILNEHKKR